jgi:hypothetical protein
MQGQRRVRSILRLRASATLLLVDSTSTTFKGASHVEQHCDLENLLVRVLRRCYVHVRLPADSERSACRMPLWRGLRLRIRLHLPPLAKLT